MKKQTLYIAAVVLILAAIAAVFTLSLPGTPAVTEPASSTGIPDATATQTTMQTTATQTTAAQTTAEATTATLPPVSETATTPPREPVDSARIIRKGNTADGRIRLGFTGDINLDDTWENSPMQVLRTMPGGIADCIDADLINKMRGADILLVNNEFAFTARGQKQNKPYTFRSGPSNVGIYKTLGVDIAALANNHIYDYRLEGLTDTIATLEGAGIACIGAGETLQRAARPAYFEINGKIIAYIAAGRTESWFNTPAAGSGKAGILNAYGSDDCVNAIREAAANSDYVIVYVHWGTEGSHGASTEQLVESKRYIDAGASAVIGSHPHVLQGMDFYKNRFIAFSLGNFWFNMKSLETVYLELVIDPDGSIRPFFTPCMQEQGKTYIVRDPAKTDAIVRLIENNSPRTKIRIQVDGSVVPR